MKKYRGKKDWSESLYFSKLTQEDIDKLELIDETPYEGFVAPGFFDEEHYMGFIDHNVFEDMNVFITYSEIFNIFQSGKI